jgi:site-specific DNA recombinase
MEKRIAAYARVSTAGQASKGQSIPEQLERIRDYCQAKNYTVVAEFTDAGVSGLSMDRPGFQDMLRQAQEGRLDGIAFYDSSRWSRASEGPVIRDRLREAGLRVISVSESTGDTEDPFQDEFTEDVLAAQAKAHSRKLQKEMPGRMRGALIRGGKGIGTSPPFGYRKEYAISDGKPELRMVPDEATAPIVAQAFQAYADGASTRDLANMLEPYGGPKGSSAVSRLLRNPKYVGATVIGRTTRRKVGGKIKTTYQPRESWAIRENAHEPIVSHEVFNRVQAMLDLRGTAKERTRSQPTINPFPNGMIRCANCGSVVECHKAEKPPYPTTYTFMCKNRREQGAERGQEQCKGSIRVERIVQNALAKVARVFEGDQLIEAAALHKPKPDPALAAATKKLETLRKRQANLTNAIADHGWSDTLGLKLQEVELAIPSVEKQIGAIRAAEQKPIDIANLRTDAHFIKTVLNTMLTEEKLPRVRRILSRVFERIVIHFPTATAKREHTTKYYAKRTSQKQRIEAAKQLAELERRGQDVEFVFTWDRNEELLEQFQAATNVRERFRPKADVV